MSAARTLDESLLATYLSDHVAAAAGMRNRVARMVRAYPQGPLAHSMRQLAQALDGERDWLITLTDSQQVHLSRWKSLAVAGAERLGRLKLNGRVVRTSPLSPLLELELLNSGLRGKRSLWLTLQEWSSELRLDEAELQSLLADVDDQIEQAEQLAAQIRVAALGVSPS